MIKQTVGNLLEAKENIICHQVNCQGVMGGGLALQLRKKWPNVYEDYRIEYLSQRAKLGHVSHSEVAPDKFVFNLYAQWGFDNEECQTDYFALETSLRRMIYYAMKRNFSIAIPYHLGCGLAGGDWNIVYPLIEKTFNDYNFDATIYILESELKNESN